MRSRLSRFLAVLALVSATGVVFAGSGLGCASMAGGQGLSTFDMCFLFDCQGGALGGLVDPCSTSGGELPLFTDCPEFQPEEDG